MTHIAVSGKGGAQLTPGVEHYLVDRPAVGAELDDQGIEGNGVDHDRDEDLALPGGQFGVHGAAEPFPVTRPAIRQAKELEPAGIRMMHAP